MPWTVDDVEQHAHGLTPDQKRAWVAVANDALARCEADGGEDCDAQAIRQANAAAMHASEGATFAVRDDAAVPAIHVYQPLGFAEPPEWAPFLPVPGQYAHPLYGDLDFSPEVYDRIVANFQSGRYQERIPVNAEHDVAASGAVGWITDLRRGDDGGIDARVEWNDRGRALIEGDRFRYVSAEVFDVWTDPVSGEAVPNVAVGMAICTNPYFKESVLRPLAASEAVITRVADAAAPATVSGEESPKETTMTEKETVENKEVAQPPGVTDDAVKQLTERILAEIGGEKSVSSPVVTSLIERMAGELAERDARTTKAEAEAKRLSEQNAVLLVQNRVKAFTDEAMGRSPDNGTAYSGDIPDIVRMFCSLAERYGDKSWEVEHYKTLNRAHAEQIKAGSLFSEIGTGRGGEETQTAYDQIDALARELAKTQGISHERAFAQVLEHNDELRAAHARERRGGR